MNCMDNQNKTAREQLPRKGPQTTETGGLLCPGMSLMQARRIARRLREGDPERSIARAERVPERYVTQVRRAELERHERLMHANGVALGGMLESIRIMHREIDATAFDELAS